MVVVHAAMMVSVVVAAHGHIIIMMEIIWQKNRGVTMVLEKSKSKASICALRDLAWAKSFREMGGG